MGSAFVSLVDCTFHLLLHFIWLGEGIALGHFFALRWIPRCRAYKSANWSELAKNTRLHSPILDRTFGSLGPLYKHGKDNRPDDSRTEPSAPSEILVGLSAKFDTIVHVCVIPTYKEPLGTLRKTISTLCAQTCAKDKLIICVATESRDRGAPEKVRTLMAEFGDGLLGFFYTSPSLPR